MKNDEYIKKWLNNQLSDEERSYFEQSEDFRSLQKLSDRIKFFRAPEYVVETELARLSNIKAASANIVSINWINTLMRVAAVVVFVVGAYLLLFYKSPTVVQTFSGEKTEIYLPDSSLVLINADSRISFNAKKWSENRKVKLVGEAFFQVTGGSRFDVISESGTVSVLGTQFNIKERTNFFEVVCYEGLVRVEASDSIQHLQANNVFRLVYGKVESTGKKLVDKAPSWIREESSFESVPVGVVIEEFELQFGKKVETDDIDLRKLFTGTFGHKDMELALQTITQPLNLNYYITEEGRIVITGDRN